MIRLLGMALLGGGCAMLGFSAAASLSARVRDLSGIILGLEALKRSLSGNLERMEGMLTAAAEAAGGQAGVFFHRCGRELSEISEGFSAVWTAALTEGDLRLLPCDRGDLRGLGQVLGSYDLDSQLAAVEEALKRLEVRLNEARERKKSLYKVYGTLGVSAGAALVILLM